MYFQILSLGADSVFDDDEPPRQPGRPDETIKLVGGGWLVSQMS